MIISNDTLNENWPRIIVIAFSSQTHPMNPGKIFIPKDICKLEKDSVILTQEVRSIDKSRLVKKIGVLPEEKLLEVEDSLKLVLGMIDLDQL